MQKKAIRFKITFSNCDAHTSPFFAQLNLLKPQDHIKLQTFYFKHQFETGKLPKIFYLFYAKTSQLGVPTIFQKFEQTMVNLIFDTTDQSCGMKLMRDSGS